MTPYDSYIAAGVLIILVVTAPIWNKTLEFKRLEEDERRRK